MNLSELTTSSTNLISFYTSTVDICNKDFLFYLFSALMQTFGALLAIIIAAWTFFIRNKLEIFESNIDFPNITLGHKTEKRITKGHIHKAFEINYKHVIDGKHWTIDDHINELLYGKLLKEQSAIDFIEKGYKALIPKIEKKELSDEQIKTILNVFNENRLEAKHRFHKYEVLISLILKSDFPKLHKTYINYLEFLKIAIWVIGISTFGLLFAKFFIPMGYLVSVLSIVLSIIGLWKLYNFIKEIL